MAEVKDITLNINVDDSVVKKELTKSIKLAERLEKQLSKMENMKIGIEVITVKKKWYQFWK